MVASVQELIAAAQAGQQRSPLAQLLDNGMQGWDAGRPDRNMRLDTSIKLLQMQEAQQKIAEEQQKMQQRAELAKQFAADTAIKNENDIQNKFNGVTPPVPVTRPEKFQTEWKMTEDGLSKTMKSAETKSPEIPSGYRATANGNYEYIPGGPADPEVLARNKQLGGDGTDVKDQRKLYHQSVTNLRQVFSSRSGNLGLQDAKVNTATHLAALADQYYNPATGTHDIPEAQSAELVMGLANLVSGSNVATVEGLKSITPKNYQKDMAHIISYWTGKPVTAQPEAMTKNIIDSIDRQGTVAEDQRNTYLQQMKDAFVEPGLDEQGTKRLLGLKVGSSYKDYLAIRNASRNGSSGGGANTVPAVGSTFQGAKVLKVEQVK